MAVTDTDKFNEIWLVDFEFKADLGEKPRPICLVALELKSGRLLRIWEDKLLRMTTPPYPINQGVLFVAYYASAEIGCHLALGWPVPPNILDLFVEFRNTANGVGAPCGFGLLGALAAHGLPAIDAVEKEEMRALAMRGGPWTREERDALIDYCESDVRALERLLPRMLPQIDLPRALIRGRYMAAAARIEHRGVPIDVQGLITLKSNWDNIQDTLIESIDSGFEVFDGRSFKAAKFAQWLAKNNIPWPRLASGALDLKSETFKDMARAYPVLQPLRELRVSLSQMRLSELPVGTDGRNRTMLSAFKSKTGRNQPSNASFIFGPSCWLRGLIKPEPGMGLAYIDWSQQEFAIAAALSGDSLMQQAYLSGDPYLAFAIQAGAAPKDATKASHGKVREQFKACVLAVQYGMGADSLAVRIGQPTIRAKELLALHRQTYKAYWAWSDAVLDHAMLHGKLWTVFGWNLRLGNDPNPRSLRNFLMQANGAEMLRLACIMTTEADIGICAPVHDAILIEAPLESLDEVIATTQKLMQRAGEIVLNGFPVGSDAKIVRFPERYMDGRGKQMWNTVWSTINAKKHN
jgi:hypothetical protein